MQKPIFKLKIELYRKMCSGLDVLDIPKFEKGYTKITKSSKELIKREKGKTI